MEKREMEDKNDKRQVRVSRFKANPREALRGLVNVHERAARNNLPVLTQLEREDPTPDWRGDDAYKLDAFGRMLHAAGVVTRSNPAAGLYATPMSDLLIGEHQIRTPGSNDTEPIGRELGRALFMVWVERQVRRVKYGKAPTTRSLFVAENEDDEIGGPLRPFYDGGGVRDLPELQPAIPITSLIASDIQIQGPAYRAIYVNDVEVGDFDLQRVAEGTELPEVEIGLHTKATRMHKKGRAVTWTYEAARQLRLDKMRLAISKMALDVEYSKVVDAIETLVSGDGNAGTAPETIALSSLDSSAAGQLTLRALLQAKRLFRGAYRLNVILAQTEEIVNLEMLEIGLNAVPLVALPASQGIGQITRIGDDRTRDAIQYADVPGTEVPTGNYLLMDNRFALERVSEIGAEISEADRFITSQRNVITFSDVDGFATIFPKAVKILDTTA